MRGEPGGVGDGEASELGHDCLAAMDGEAHGDEGRDERDGDHRQGAEDEGEEAFQPESPPLKN